MERDVLERLLVLIEASTTGLRQELVKGANDVSTFQKRVDADVRRAEMSFGSLGGTLRKTLGAFGIVLSARAFAGWIRGALDAKNMTEEQLEATKEARAALEAFRESSDSLARGLAGVLAPAIANIATSMEHLRRAFLPTDTEALDQQIENTENSINRLAEGLIAFENGSYWRKLLFDDGMIANVRAEIEALREQLQRLYAERGKGGPDNLELFDIDAIRAQRREVMRSFKFDPKQLLAPIDISKGQRLSPELDAYIEQLERGAAVTADMRTEVERQVQQWREALALFDEGAISGETLGRVQDSLLQPIEVTAKRLDALKKEVDKGFADVAASVGSAFQDTLTNAFLGIDSSFSDLLRRMAANLLASGLTQALGSLFSGATGPVGSFFGAAFGGARASGGPVSAGKSYLIGERGPEIFRPDVSGMILTAAQARAAAGGGDVKVIVNNTAGPQVKAEARQTGPGLVEIMIGMVNGEIARGAFDPAFAHRFGMRPTTGIRS